MISVLQHGLKFNYNHSHTLLIYRKYTLDLFLLERFILVLPHMWFINTILGNYSLTFFFKS